VPGALKPLPTLHNKKKKKRKNNSQAEFKKGKRKEVYLYSAFIVANTLKALRRGSHSFTCK